MPADAGLDWRAVRNQPARATAEKPPGTHSGSGLRRNRSGGSNHGSSPTPRKLCEGIGDADGESAMEMGATTPRSAGKDRFVAVGGAAASPAEMKFRAAEARALGRAAGGS